MPVQIGRLASLSLDSNPPLLSIALDPPTASSCAIAPEFTDLPKAQALFATALQSLLRIVGVSVTRGGPNDSGPIKVTGEGTFAQLDACKLKAAAFAGVMMITDRVHGLDVNALLRVIEDAIKGRQGPSTTAQVVAADSETAALLTSTMKQLLGTSFTAGMSVAVMSACEIVFAMLRATSPSWTPTTGDTVRLRHPRSKRDVTGKVVDRTNWQGRGLWRRGIFVSDPPAEETTAAVLVLIDGKDPEDAAPWLISRGDLTPITTAATTAAYDSLDSELSRIVACRTVPLDSPNTAALFDLSKLVQARRPRILASEARALFRLLLQGFAPMRPRPADVAAADAFFAGYLTMRLRALATAEQKARMPAADLPIATVIAEFLTTSKALAIGDRVVSMIDGRSEAELDTHDVDEAPMTKLEVHDVGGPAQACKLRFETAARVSHWFGGKQLLVALRPGDKVPDGQFGAFVEPSNAKRLTDGHNIGIVLTEHFITLDFPNALAIAWAERFLPPTPLRTRTPHGGEHWFYGHPGGAGGRFHTARFGIDTRPSTHGMEGQIAQHFVVEARGDGCYAPLPGCVLTRMGGDGYYRAMGQAWFSDEAPIVPTFDSAWLSSRPEPLPSPRAFAAAVEKNLQRVAPMVTLASGTPKAVAPTREFKLFRDAEFGAGKIGLPNPGLLSAASSQRGKSKLDGGKFTSTPEQKLKDRILDLEHALRNAKKVERYYLGLFVGMRCAPDLLNTGTLFHSTDRIVEAMAVRRALRMLENADGFIAQTIVVDGHKGDVDHIAALLAFTTKSQIIVRKTRGAADGKQQLPLPKGLENVKRLSYVGPRAHVVSRESVVHIVVGADALPSLKSITASVTSPRQHVIALGHDGYMRALVGAFKPTCSYTDPGFTDRQHVFAFFVGAHREAAPLEETATAHETRDFHLHRRLVGQGFQTLIVREPKGPPSTSPRWLAVDKIPCGADVLARSWAEALTAPGSATTLAYAISNGDAFFVGPEGVKGIPLEKVYA